ncbi:relaxase/mobilization nuclease domain-containing protein, partial [Dysgonomonas sp. BGC7]|uniref:relaxase/mobilization nuclease domain-containing protein n=1 Tax=Dysgonomonas sp. BGC7 TaxID=1658008 RepID=UPI0009E50C9E
AGYLAYIVYNRIDNNGKVISDKNDRYRNEAVCKKIKNKYGLSYGKGKDKVKQHRLKGKNKTRYEIYSAVKDALSKSANWNDLEKLLKEKGISVSYKYRGQTREVQGISFTKDNTTFKGSEIDRSFSYSKINGRLEENAYGNKQEKDIAHIPNNTHKNQTYNQGTDVIGALIDGIDSLSTFQTHGDDPEEERFRHNMEYLQKKINRKNNKRPKLR